MDNLNFFYHEIKGTTTKKNTISVSNRILTEYLKINFYIIRIFIYLN